MKSGYLKRITGYIILCGMFSLVVLCYNSSASAKSNHCVIKGKTLIKYDGKASTFEVPDKVRKISSKAFTNASNLKCLVIGPNVKEIKEGTLRNAKKLQSVKVSKKNKTYSSVKGLLYDKYQYELYECPNACKNVVISDKCRVINTIAGDRIRKIVIGKNVESYTSEYSEMIGHTPNLRQIEVKVDNTHFFVRDGVLFYRESGNIILAKYPSAVTCDEYVIPDDVNDFLECSFGDARVKNLVFPSSIKKISNHPFHNANIDSFTFCGNCSEISYLGTIKHYEFWSGLSFLQTADNKVKKYVFKDDEVLLPSLEEVCWIRPDITICSRVNSSAHRYAVQNDLQWIEYMQE